MPGESHLKFTPQQVADTITEAHGLVSRAAKMLGCTVKTVYNYIEKFPEVAEARHEAREAMKDVGEASLWKKVSEGEGWAVCFYLKCQAKDRGYVERQEIEHQGAVPVKHIILEDEKTDAS